MSKSSFQVMVGRVDRMNGCDVIVGRVIHGLVRPGAVCNTIGRYIYERDPEGCATRGAILPDLRKKPLLRVQHIHFWNHLIDEAEQGLVVGLEVTGTGLELVAPDAVLEGINAD